MSFPGDSDSKESACRFLDLGSKILGSRRCLGNGNDNALQYSCLENSMDREAWQATVYDIAKIFPIAQLVKNTPAVQETLLQYWVGKIHCRMDRLPTSVFLGFFCGSAGKESACNAENLGWIHGLGRFLGEWKGYPFQYSGLENSMDCIVHGVTQSRTWLSRSRTGLSSSHFQELSRTEWLTLSLFFFKAPCMPYSIHHIFYNLMAIFHS